MDGPAVILAPGKLASSNGKTAHGLVRGSDRYRIVGVVDAAAAGRDAGEVVDGRPRGIPVFASLGEALERAAERPRFAIVGIATPGGRFVPEIRAPILEAIERGLSIVNGLHEYAAEDPEMRAAAERHGVTLVDVRRPPPVRDLHFWTGESRRLRTPRIAVLGTDCALGKRTTARMLVEACRASGLRAEMIYTGQTGWMQGARFGIILDALPNDFVSGELEHAILACARDAAPDVMFIEGQAALRNPSGPCGSEMIVSVGARGVVLQHAPGRPCFKHTDIPIPPLGEEIELVRLLGGRVIALSLNSQGLSPERLRDEKARLAAEHGLPVAAPLEDGVAGLVPAIREHVRAEAAR